MHFTRTTQRIGLLLLAAFGCGALPALAVADEPPLILVSAAQVDGEGIFLSPLLAAGGAPALPQLRLADSPAFGQAVILTRAQILEAALKAAPNLASTNWAGAVRVRVTRRARPFTETELREQLTAVLQREHVGDKGELELRLTRPWGTLAIPDDPCTWKILDLPTTGISPSFVVRFELRTPHGVVGSWQIPVQARVWKEV